jgi:hypothetical protein
MLVVWENFEVSSNPRASENGLNHSSLDRVSTAVVEAEVTGTTELLSLTMKPVHRMEEKVFAQFNDKVK